MSLNPTEPMNHPVTFEYDAEHAWDWAMVVKHLTRKLSMTGKVDPCGGLVDVLMCGGGIAMLQFRRREPGDHRRYAHLSPKIYNGTEWVPAAAYVEEGLDRWRRAAKLVDNIGGRMPDMPDRVHHKGKFPPGSEVGGRFALIRE